MSKFSWIILLALTAIAPITQAVEVIAHSSVNTDTLSLKQLRNIFFMRTRSWPDGSPIKVYVLGDNNALHKTFSKQNLAIFPYKLRRAWDRYIYSGTGQSPNRVEDEAEMIRVISSTEGAIGYTNKETGHGHVIEIR